MNFNEAGVEYQILTQKIASLPSGGMKQRGMEAYLKLREEISKAYKLSSRSSNILDNVYVYMHHFET
ncbi:hypothetical protein [Methylobacterium radiodurans]|uniref:hypothetical protein n=1 Tax=Methylobacterium radiodurans TaxID=2202828 RepID=UPI0013A5963A|nr:hypothetical protein [Methylobacterium radiodurans]